MTRKIISVMLAVCISVEMLAGCGSTKGAGETGKSEGETSQLQKAQTEDGQMDTQTGTATGTEEVQDLSFEGQEMSFVAFGGGGYSEYWEEVVKRFEDTWKVTVNMEMTPQVNDLLQTKFASGDVPDVAVLTYDGSAIANAVVEDHALMDLTALLISRE